jgi:murein tripeptide amidase MpaA
MKSSTTFLQKISSVCRATFLLVFPFLVSAQSILPPIQDWHGQSEALIVSNNNPWITPTEKANFVTTPTYDETKQWLKKLCNASPLLTMVTIGKSPEGRDLFMVIASTEKNTSSGALRKSNKPTLLVEAGIHAGEIDGKDAGMMLLRDIAFGNKKNLINKVNFLFIPILNVDGHERSSAFNRPNQRGPENMGWRTNAQNLNLNRDFAKLDTKEIRAVVKVINDYDPVLFMDIHVTDGADYQYDITFGGWGGQGYSTASSNWLATTYKTYADKALSNTGHIPGQLLFTVNDRDFSEGNFSFWGEPRFSDAYGDLRHTPALLIENHSLKPFKQRVLGTYILVESTLELLALEGESLRKATQIDRAKRTAQIPLQWKTPKSKPDSLLLLGIASKLLKSPITNDNYVEWTGKPFTATIPNYKKTEAADFVNRPKGYYVPVFCTEIIERLKMHGIKMDVLQTTKEVNVEMYRIQDAKFQNSAGKISLSEGHTVVKGNPIAENRIETFAAGSIYISTDQPLGDLAIILLEPKSPDSYFSWGFFNSIFQRTEYIEAYVMEPIIQKMLKDSPALQAEFDDKKAKDSAFANDRDAIYTWFYSKTKYYDSKYLLYPVGRLLQ